MRVTWPAPQHLLSQTNPDCSKAPDLGTDIELVKGLIRDGDRCRDNDCQGANIEQGLNRAGEFYKDAADVVLLVRVSQNMQGLLQLVLDACSNAVQVYTKAANHKEILAVYACQADLQRRMIQIIPSGLRSRAEHTLLVTSLAETFCSAALVYSDKLSQYQNAAEMFAQAADVCVGNKRSKYSWNSASAFCYAAAELINNKKYKEGIEVLKKAITRYEDALNNATLPSSKRGIISSVRTDISKLVFGKLCDNPGLDRCVEMSKIHQFLISQYANDLDLQNRSWRLQCSADLLAKAGALLRDRGDVARSKEMFKSAATQYKDAADTKYARYLKCGAGHTADDVRTLRLRLLDSAQVAFAKV